MLLFGLHPLIDIHYVPPTPQYTQLPLSPDITCPPRSRSRSPQTHFAHRTRLPTGAAAFQRRQLVSPGNLHQQLAHVVNVRHYTSATITDTILSFTTCVGQASLIRGHHLIAKLNYCQRTLQPNILPTIALQITHAHSRNPNTGWTRDLFAEGIEHQPGPPNEGLPPASQNLRQMFQRQINISTVTPSASSSDIGPHGIMSLRAIQNTILTGSMPTNATLVAAL